MKERVTTLLGTCPVIIVAPHGHHLDDSHTCSLAMAAAEELGAFAVINNDWKRSQVVDELKGLANCNNINHCQEPVVKAEFLDPIHEAISVTLEEYFNKVIDTDNYGLGIHRPLVLMIHGVGNSIRTKAKDPNLDLIVGFGAGDKPKFTCQQSIIDAFIDSAQMFGSWKTYEGAPGGDYSARSSKNLTQALYRQQQGNINVLQLEFVYEMRSDDVVAEATGKKLAKIINIVQSLPAYLRPDNMIPPPKI